jgi:serine/threonine protein kinase
LVKYAKTERDVLALSDHNFIVKMYFAFQNTRNVFLLLEYCPGGDLGKVLKKERKFSEEVAKIYVCEVLLALEYLHSKGVMYRDLKPDNIMVDHFGHVKLVDFGLSKLNVDEGYSSTSFLGTHAYLAPEILQNRNYGKSVDWYNLGVLMYEFLVGVPPYYSDNIDKLYENIKTGAIQFPRSMSLDARDLISKLMIRNPMTRLGFNGAQEIKEHPFFADVEWSNYEKRLPDGNYADIFPP